MKHLWVLLARIAGVLRRRPDTDVDGEIREHLDLLAAEHQRRGLSPDAARLAARRDFGGVEPMKEIYRDQRRFRLFETLRQDVQYSFRALRRAPGFTIVAVLTLAFGILANTTIFSAVNAVLFQPLPVDKPEEIVELFIGDGQLDGGTERGASKVSIGSGSARRHLSGHTYRAYTQLRDANEVFSALVATKTASVSLVADGQPVVPGQPTGLVQGEIVSGTYFDMMGIRAARGRTITPEDDRTPNAHPVIVVSDRLWRRQLNADPDALGRVVRLNGHPFTVIGIAPATFSGSLFAVPMDFWAPLMMQGQLGSDPDWWRPNRMREFVVFCAHPASGAPQCSPSREAGDLRLLARLKPAVALAVASERLNALSRRLAVESPPPADPVFAPKRTTVKAMGRLGARETPPPADVLRLSIVPEPEARHHEFIGQVRRISVVAFLATALVWLVACGNVTNLMLARATVRSREIAVRLALGASRWRIARQLLTETTMIAVLGGGLAALLTFWTAGLLGAATPPGLDMPLTFDFTPDIRVLAWALGLSLVTGVVFGFAPTWQAARTNLVPALKPGEGGSARGARRLTFRNALVVGQLALSVVVLVAGVLFARSVQHAREAFHPGFATDALLSMRFEPRVLNYDPARVTGFYRDLLTQLKTVPRVEDASFVGSPPFGMGYGNLADRLVAVGAPPPISSPEVGVHVIGPRYFRAMGIRLAAGREFEGRDDGKAPAVAMLSAAEARILFGSELEAIGKRVHGNEAASGAVLEVVGVVAGRTTDVPMLQELELFLPVLQRESGSNMTLVIRATSARDLRSVARVVQQKVQQLDPLMPVTALRLGQEHEDPRLEPMRLGAEVALVLGFLALAMAALGLYGVISYAVSVRTREIGVRIALGARSTHVQAMVVRQALALTLVGLAIGLGAALLLTPVLQAFLFGVRVADAPAFIAVSAVLTVIALLASYLPTRRATRIDATVALKCE